MAAHYLLVYNVLQYSFPENHWFPHHEIHERISKVWAQLPVSLLLLNDQVYPVITSDIEPNFFLLGALFGSLLAGVCTSCMPLTSESDISSATPNTVALGTVNYSSLKLANITCAVA